MKEEIYLDLHPWVFHALLHALPYHLHLDLWACTPFYWKVNDTR
jgi:hypothetical protein